MRVEQVPYRARPERTTLEAFSRSEDLRFAPSAHGESGRQQSCTIS